MEVELKMLIAEPDMEALRQHPLLAQFSSTGPCEVQMFDTYFDTPEWHFRRAHAGLRVRRIRDTWVQTMKAGGSSRGGLHCRHEWESIVAGASPDLADLRKAVKRRSPWGTLLRMPGIDDRMTPLFTVKVKRTVWTLRLARGDEVECVLDVGQLTYGDAALPITELELELKSGDPARLYELALGLQRDVPFQLARLSKAERGYALLLPQARAAAKAEPVKLFKKMTVEQAFLQIAPNCIAHILGNDEGMAQSTDGEALHQMRVGVRRLRAALKLFGKVLPVPSELERELDWLGAELGPARDWDVLASSTLDVVARAAPADIILSDLRRVVSDMALVGRDDAASAVKSPRFTRLILLFSGWIVARTWRESTTPRQQRRLAAPVSKFAGMAQAQSQRRLSKQAAALHGADQEALHRIRIATKKARYAAEFFLPLAPSKRTHRYIKALSEMQNSLGWLNDAANADTMLKELSHEDANLIGSIAFVRGYLASRVEVDSGDVQRRWKLFIAAIS